MSEYPVIIHRVLEESVNDGPRVSFRSAVAQVRDEHRELIDAGVDWANAHDRELDPDVVALLIGAAVEGFDEGPATFWSQSRLLHMFCCHINNWCFDHLAECDDDDDDGEHDRESLWLFVTFLVETGRLDLASDPPSVLFDQLNRMGVDYAGYETQDERFWEYGAFEIYDGPTFGELEADSGVHRVGKTTTL